MTIELNEEYQEKFDEVINLMIDQNDTCCDLPENEILLAETIIKILKQRIRGLKKNVANGGFE